MGGGGGVRIRILCRMSRTVGPLLYCILPFRVALVLAFGWRQGMSFLASLAQHAVAAEALTTGSACKSIVRYGPADVPVTANGPQTRYGLLHLSSVVFHSQHAAACLPSMC